MHPQFQIYLMRILALALLAAACYGFDWYMSYRREWGKHWGGIL